MTKDCETPGKGRSERPRRIVVESERAEEEENGVVALDIPNVVSETGTTGALVIPSQAQFELILAKAETCEELLRVERMAAACVDLTKRCDQLRGQLAESVVFRLRSRHKLGLVLIQTVWPGGKRTKGRKDVSEEHRLPRTLDRREARKCRELAKIPEPLMEEYFKAMTSLGKLPSEVGVHRFAGSRQRDDQVPPKQRKARKLRAATNYELVFSSAILDCVQRVLGQIDVCIGDAEVKCRVRQQANILREHDLCGTVFVAECLRPDVWLPKLAALRKQGQVNEVLVALPAMVSEPWFKALIGHEAQWSCCFPTAVRPPLLLAHLGHHYGFEVAFSEVGAVVHPVDLCPER